MNNPEYEQKQQRIFQSGNVSVWNERNYGTNETALYLRGARIAAGRGHYDHHIIRRAKELANEQN